MNTLQRFVLFQLLPWTFILGGGVALGLGILQVVEALRSKSWPQATGKVKVSEVGSSSGSISSGGSAVRYKANIIYEYEVQGAKHIGDRVTVADHASTSGAKHHRIAQRYPLGADITVYYNPNNPDESLLEPGLRFAPFILIIIGLFASSIGLGIKWLSYRLVFENPSIP